ncbi:MAG: nitroreductase family deazaflavin-dependent oxidoreductase [Deltaproteobacteria bacterium]|nr:nitroreductase family deazaflavin-dependent oxidoreductase [Deltaproteobacteria bacterium]MBI3386555.1 nitroreductase family deazaflavin-dependent oxidoreductase [Deltaproteobacteria bacterium]
MTAADRIFNRLFGALVGLGVGLSHNYLLEVRGRKTGTLYSTPIDLLRRENRLFLVAPRGFTQWVRNALAAGRVTLKKGRQRNEYRLQNVDDAQKPELLKAYLDRFKLTVQRFFLVPAGSPVAGFVPLIDRYPVFELVRSDDTPGR